MTSRTVPFHYGLFYNAMIALLGREPDRHHCYGDDGYYTFRYKPRSEDEEKKFGNSVAALRDWLRIFEITPLDSRCEFGRLPHPQEDEENQNYLEITIVQPVENREGP